MKDNEQMTSNSFFIETILKQTGWNIRKISEQSVLKSIKKTFQENRNVL